ncbi:MAG TPA: menaquinone biosynthesis protein [Tepidisphaeraceae bacterium]|nr:menaquinone biosynthesis protein [Tepidisphaeraceae bacterium]
MPPLAHKPFRVRDRLRIGSVSFLNAKPLIHGLESHDGLDLTLDVPSRLLDGLVKHRFDVALLPVIDYQRMAGLRLLTAGGIGCDGPTLTVRIFSPVPISEIQTLACDTDSHTSVALARVVLAERWGIRPEFRDLPRDESRAGPRIAGNKTARLLIGDKVVCDEPAGLPHQLDLGGAWKDLTGLPFVFAAWMARAETQLRDLPSSLRDAKTSGLQNIAQIIARHALPHGWPADIARTYLTQYLKYDIGLRQLEAIRLFHELAHKHGMLEQAPRELEIAQ